MSHKHLSLEERHYLQVDRKLGAYMNKIAQALSLSQSTVSRELERNTGQR